MLSKKFDAVVKEPCALSKLSIPAKNFPGKFICLPGTLTPESGWSGCCQQVFAQRRVCLYFEWFLQNLVFYLLSTRSVSPTHRYELLYNCGLLLLHAGHSSPAFECLIAIVPVFHSNPRLWLRVAECCIQKCTGSGSHEGLCWGGCYCDASFRLRSGSFRVKSMTNAFYFKLFPTSNLPRGQRSWILSVVRVYLAFKAPPQAWRFFGVFAPPLPGDVTNCYVVCLFSKKLRASPNRGGNRTRPTLVFSQWLVREFTGRSWSIPPHQLRVWSLHVTPFSNVVNGSNGFLCTCLAHFETQQPWQP